MGYLKKIFILILSISAIKLTAQQDEPKLPNTPEEYKQMYEWRINQTFLNGQYIPKDLPDALAQLNKLTDEDSKAKFAALSENDAVHKLYFSLGRWICTNWGFYEGSRLSQYLKEVNVTFPEDQAISIILAWHRTLNKKDINFKEIRDRLVAKRKKELEERLKKAEVVKEIIKKPAPEGVKN